LPSTFVNIRAFVVQTDEKSHCMASLQGDRWSGKHGSW